jgi:hypothetical protein
MARRKAKPDTANRWRNRIVGEGEEAPDQLLANPLNFRIHSNHQGKVLTGALDALGWVQRVVVNRRTGHVVDGHLRVKLALQQGEGSIPVVYVDLDETEERIALATLDPIAAMAGTDDAQLAALLEGVDVEDADLATFLAELKPEDSSSGGHGPSTDDPVTVPGELILLGHHRLLCGDPTQEDDQQAALGRNGTGSILDLIGLCLLPLLDAKPGPQLCIVERDPLTCDAIVNAWEKAVGRKAKRKAPG